MAWTYGIGIVLCAETPRPTNELTFHSPIGHHEIPGQGRAVRVALQDQPEFGPHFKERPLSAFV